MTNKKLSKYLDSHPDLLVKSSYFAPISIVELKAFVGLMILNGVFRASREPLNDLFSDDLNLGRPIFRAAMPRERMKVILKFLRFDEDSTRAERLLIDNLAPIRHVFNSVNTSLDLAYRPGKFVTIDEHLCRYKGRCKFRQYIPSKPDRYGLKCWVVADSLNFYPLNVEVFTGKNILYPTKSEELTMRMTSKLEPGHVVVGDSYFTSLRLSRQLLNERGIFYLGTVNKIRREIPKCFTVVKDLKVHSSKFYYSANNTLVSYVPTKNRKVLLLSNIHFLPEISSTPKLKPQMILDYNRNKSGVDKLDQMMKEYRPYRTTRRWPCVIFYDLIAFATQAAYVLFCIKFPSDVIAKFKSRKKFLYLLGVCLVTPLIKLRKDSPNFRYLSSDVKKTINNICFPKVNKVDGMEVVTDPTTIIVDVTLSGTSEAEDIAQMPVSEQTENELTPEIMATETSAEALIPVLELTENETAITATETRGVTQILVSDATHSIDGSNGSSFTKPTKSLYRVGRCSTCDRKSDKKTKRRCESCGVFICHIHSKIIYLCEGCQDC